MRTSCGFWDGLIDRSLDTIAVWNFHAPTFQVGALTLPIHCAHTLALATRLDGSIEADETLETARDDRNRAARNLRDLYWRARWVLADSLPKGHPIIEKIKLVHSVKSQAVRVVQEKGEKLVGIWKSINELRAAMSPPLEPLMVDATDVSALESLLVSFARLLANVADKQIPCRQARKALDEITVTIYGDNIRWYTAWEGHFPKDSPQLAALGRIHTAPGPAEGLPGTAVFLQMETLPGHEVKLSFGAARAKTFTLVHKGPGEEAFTVLGSGLKERSFIHSAGVAGEHIYKVLGENCVGVGAESMPLTVPVAQAQVAEEQVA